MSSHVIKATMAAKLSPAKHVLSSKVEGAPGKQNSKSEYRNPKQTQKEIKLKLGKSKTPNPKEACLELFLFWSFEIVSNFGFRASNFFGVFARVTSFPISASRYSTENFK